MYAIREGKGIFTCAVCKGSGRVCGKCEGVGSVVQDNLKVVCPECDGKGTK